MRGSLALLVSIVLLGSTGAAADTFGGWRYTAPPGYSTESYNDHVALTKVMDTSFCSISIFEVRRLEKSLAVERAYEWHNTVGHAFSAHTRHRGSLATKIGTVTTTTATLVDPENHRYAASHFILTPPGRIGSVLVLADTHASLASCGEAAVGLVRSLELDWTSPKITDPEARVETPQGRWTSLGATSREYTFAADGTYRFHSETTRSGPVQVIDEAGTYTVLADQLTLTPRTSFSATVSRGVAKQARVRLMTTTYSWGKRYVPESNEWFIVLTPEKPTTRDGDRPASYQYSDLAKAAWKFAPAQPGV